MEEGTVFYAVEHDGHIVSAASAEINAPYGHAELTDCATLPSYRKLGFMHHLILALEKNFNPCTSMSFILSHVHCPME